VEGLGGGIASGRGGLSCPLKKNQQTINSFSNESKRIIEMFFLLNNEFRNKSKQYFLSLSLMIE
jgi:hypothetical protein